MAVATPIPSCLGLGSYTSGSPAIVEAWFYGLQRGWRPHYTPTLGFHLIYRGKGPLEENAKASYEGSLPGVALDGGLVPALPRTHASSLPFGSENIRQAAGQSGDLKWGVMSALRRSCLCSCAHECLDVSGAGAVAQTARVASTRERSLDDRIVSPFRYTGSAPSRTGC